MKVVGARVTDTCLRWTRHMVVEPVGRYCPYVRYSMRIHTMGSF